MIAVALALGVALAAGGPPPLACPAGTRHHGAAPPEAYEEWCEGEDASGASRREGPSRTYYDDGTLWIEATWRAGERHGAFVEWHRGGVKAREGAFAKGRRIGRWSTWWPSGRLSEESEWRDGVRHGRFVAYWPTGTPRTEGRHCGGAQCGTWRTWDETGRELGKADYLEQTVAEQPAP